MKLVMGTRTIYKNMEDTAAEGKERLRRWREGMMDVGQKLRTQTHTHTLQCTL